VCHVRARLPCLHQIAPPGQYYHNTLTPPISTNNLHQLPGKASGHREPLPPPPFLSRLQYSVLIPPLPHTQLSPRPTLALLLRTPTCCVLYSCQSRPCRTEYPHPHTHSLSPSHFSFTPSSYFRGFPSLLVFCLFIVPYAYYTHPGCYSF
jgi:hypothetical protein